jgi:hypothetical protein
LASSIRWIRFISSIQREREDFMGLYSTSLLYLPETPIEPKSISGNFSLRLWLDILIGALSRIS